MVGPRPRTVKPYGTDGLTGAPASRNALATHRLWRSPRPKRNASSAPSALPDPTHRKRGKLTTSPGPPSQTIMRFALTPLLLSCTALAQNQFAPVGNPINTGAANAVYTVNLGFSFMMPGGNVVTAVDVDTEGRIVEVGSVPSDGSESTTEMTANPTSSINVMWDAVGIATPGGIFFQSNNSSLAVISWVNNTTPTACTFQCQLFASGNIVMVYDSRCPADDGIIGICPGNGTVLPAPSDLSGAINSTPILSANPTVFEDFGTTAGINTFDFPSSALEFIPLGGGGVNGWTVIGNIGVTDPLDPFASSESFGGGCFVPASYTYAPNGSGGYTVIGTASLFDSNIGALVGATEDDTITAINVDIGFPMLFPDGFTYTLVDIDPNGRIIPSGFNAFGDFSPTIFELNNDGYPMICGLWADWNVTESTSDGIYFNTVPGVSATFTWNNVAQFGPDPAPVSTWQVTLLATGSIQITHENLSRYNSTVSADDTIVGISNGYGPDPGEIDHTALPASTTSYPYEFWDSSGPTPAEPVTLIFDTPQLSATTNPIMGNAWELQTQQSGTANFGLYIVGFDSANIDLTGLGSPCTQSVVADLVHFQTANGLGDITPYLIGIPTTPMLAGFELFVQGAVDLPIGSGFGGFAGLPFALSWSNAIKGTVGSF